MEFTQIEQISSFLKTPTQKSITQDPFFTNQWGRQYLQEELQNESVYSDMMENLQRINTNTSLIKLYEVQSQQDNEQFVSSIEQKCINLNHSTEQYKQAQQNYQKYDKTKSIIFKGSVNSRQLLDSRLNLNFIRIFYFNSPILKYIAYNKKSTIKDLIQKALETYLLQNFDAYKASQSLQQFQLRLPSDYQTFNADMNLQAIHPTRLLCQNLFDTLVLVQKSKNQDTYFTRPTKQNSMDSSFSFSSIRSLKQSISAAETISITLKDQTFLELLRIKIDRQGTLETVFQTLKQQQIFGGQMFVIKDDIDAEFQLTQDYEVKNLQKSTLYVLPKRFIDEADEELQLRPLRFNSQIPKQKNYLPPIGLNEASKYEQFLVAKISSIGIAIERILGIDQTKIYNYEKQFRQNKKASFINKLFGNDELTGTKKPYRLIKQINSLNKFNGGVQIVFADRTTTYLIKDELILNKIIRKLTYLINNCR